ncbi:MAG: hypothetical protein WCB94_07485 [Terriglobales bacterium]
MWGRSDLLRGEKSRFSVRHVVVLLAIFAICVSVTTRMFHHFDFDHSSVHADPSRGMRQHLDADAFVVTRPVSTAGTMLLPVAAPHAPPVDVQIPTLELTESLYNRPPPSISLL